MAGPTPVHQPETRKGAGHVANFISSLTTRGRFFVSLGIALLITGLGLGMTDLTRIGVLLLALPVLATLLTRRHPLAFAISRSPVPSQVQVDEPATVTVSIVNPSRTRSPVLSAEELLDYSLGDQPRWVIPALRRGQRHTVSYPVRSHVRGRHQLGPLALGVADPFGLTTRQVALQTSTDLLVLPRVVPLPGAGVGARGVGAEGGIPHMVALHGEDDVSVRDYRDGDDLRRVHWPATARTGTLMVRQEDRPAMRRAVILLDSREEAHGPTTSRSLEWAVTMAASVAAHCEHLGYALHLVTASPGGDAPHESTSLAESLPTLADVAPVPAAALTGVVHGAGGAVVAGGLVVAIVGGCSDDDARAIAALRSLGSPALAVVVDRTTMSAPTQPGLSDDRASATAEVLRSAGWTVTVVRPGTTWAGAWAELTSAASLSGVRP